MFQLPDGLGSQLSPAIEDISGSHIAQRFVVSAEVVVVNKVSQIPLQVASWTTLMRESAATSQFPRQDETGVVVHNSHQVVVAPACHKLHLQSLHQPLPSQNAVHGGLGNGKARVVRDPGCQLPAAEFRGLPGRRQYLPIFIRSELVPGPSPIS